MRIITRVSMASKSLQARSISAHDLCDLTKAASWMFQVGRNLSDWPSWELYSEALYQLRNTAGIHLKFIATTKLTQGLRLRLSYSSEVNELPEEILEAGGRDDF